MAQVELIYDADCLNVDAARQQLRQALDSTGHRPEWVEWNRSDPESPAYARGYGSPTVLVDGKDVVGVPPADEANCCRVYQDGSGQFHGVPSVEAIVSALGNTTGGTTASNRTAATVRAWLPMVPAIGVSLLPKLACPACWPAYAGLLSAVGLGFLTDTAYLLPLTVLSLVVAVGALGWRAGRRRGYGPFVLGLLAATVVIVGKFLFDSNPAMYGGIALLVGASLWNSWPKSTASTACPACEPTGQLPQIDPPNSSRRFSNG
jgi:mercuric ion transport protein